MPKATGQLYKFQLLGRNIMDSPHSFFTRHITPMHLDNVGFFLHHDRWEQVLDHDWIRKHIACREQSFTIIQAKCPEDAIKKFHNEWIGAKIGGEGEEQKALWIDRKEPIIEMPPCSEYWLQRDGDVVCGRPFSYGGAGCVFSGYDGFDGCPGEMFWETLNKTYDKEKQKWYYPIQPIEFEYEGLKYCLLSWKQIPTERTNCKNVKISR